MSKKAVNKFRGLIDKFNKLGKKKWFIVGGAVLVVAAIVALIVVLNINNDVAVDEQDNSMVEEDSMTPPAKNVGDLKRNFTKIDVTIVGNDRIEFGEDIAIEIGDKVGVWLYSEPLFLGYFEVKEKSGVIYIDGLGRVLAIYNIEIGSHNIAIVSSDGDVIGYFGVLIEDDGGIRNEEVEGEDVIEEEQEDGDSNGDNSGATNDGSGGTSTTPQADFNLNDGIAVRYGREICKVKNNVTSVTVAETNGLARTFMVVQSSGKTYESMTQSVFTSQCDQWKATLSYDWTDETGSIDAIVLMEEYMCSALNLSCARW